MLERIKEILKQAVETDVEITEDTSLRGDLEINSIDFMDLIMAFEEEFDVEISERKAAAFQKVGDIVEFLREQGIYE